MIKRGEGCLKIHQWLGISFLKFKKGAGDSLYTNWGYVAGENRYNADIINAVKEKWQDALPPLPPKLIKAAVAVESSFDPSSISKTGYVGLLQLGISEAKSQGLKVTVPLDPKYDERFNAEKNLSAGVGVFKIKNYVIMSPVEYYSSRIETPSEDAKIEGQAVPEYAITVEDAYKKYGKPSGDEMWKLSLAGFNGGSGTVLRAMAKAYRGGLDPTSFKNLIEPKDTPASSPLYQAIEEVYPAQKVLDKYHEMSRYPFKIFELYGR